MKTLYFKVKLLTDVILNQKASTEGPNETLDFIPGNNFLGIVASALYSRVSKQDALDLFHNGKVRFGDAHFANGNARTLKVPSMMFYPKGKQPEDSLYIFHKTNRDIRCKEQLKQCRSGFYDFTSVDKCASRAVVITNFAVKSAHNRVTGTSLDDAMYGYESLQAGAELFFSVEVDREDLCNLIVEALTSKESAKRVGRSRSAQYGQVEITALPQPYKEVQVVPMEGNSVAVYADSRLIFIDEVTGLPSYRPTAEQLGLYEGEINWKKSQIRTFQYAPWNYKRQCFDTDRCGIEKGSVFIVENVKTNTSSSQYIGSYCNEGFGRVFYNPSFLKCMNDLGQAEWKLKHDSILSNSIQTPSGKLCYSNTDSLLVTHLKQIHNESITERHIFQIVNEWVDRNKLKFKDKKLSSQWGTIRGIAARRLMNKAEKEELRFVTLKDELFHKEDDKNHNGYLTHGVAEHNWEENGRLKALASLFEEIQAMSEQEQCLIIINVASQMAKIYRKELKR